MYGYGLAPEDIAILTISALILVAALFNSWLLHHIEEICRSKFSHIIRILEILEEREESENRSHPSQKEQGYFPQNQFVSSPS